MAKLRNITGSMIVAAIMAAAAATPASALVAPIPIGKAASEVSTFSIPQSAASDDFEDSVRSALASKYGSSRPMSIDCGRSGYCTWYIYNKTGPRVWKNSFHYGDAQVKKSIVKKKVVYSVQIRTLK